MNKVKLRDIADVVSGQSPKSKYYSGINGTPFLQGNRTFGYKYPIIDTYTTKVTKLALKGDVLMSVRAPVGDLNIAPMDLCIGRGLMSLRAKDGDNEFLYYALKYNIENLIRQGSGTTYDSVNRDTVLDFDLIVPKSILERKKVSKILKTIDDKVELNNKVNEELESMVKTIYNYWFVQFDFPNGDGKPYKSSGGKMIWNDKLNKEIPDGWNVTTLSENNYTEIIKPGIDKFDGNKIYLATANVIDDKIVNDKITITYNNRETRANMQPVENSVWFAKMKNSRKIMYIGEYSTKVIKNIILSTGFLGLKCKESLCLEYIWNFINDSNFEKLKDKLAHGATQQAVNNEDLSFIPLLEPDDKTLESFHNITKNMYKRKYLNEEENRELTRLKNFLLPMLMNGQVKFKNIEK